MALIAQIIFVNIDTYICPLQIMQCRSRFQWVRVDVWELGRDIIIKHQKSEQCLVPEAG